MGETSTDLRMPPNRLAPPLTALCLALTLVPSARAGAQIQLSGQLDVAANVGYDGQLSRNFHGDDPLNEIRLRLFAQHWVTDRIGLFGELLLDIDAAARVNGAYAVINQLAGRDWLNARVGLAPSLVGNFGMRSTYFNANPLLMPPLVWHYRTALDGGARASAADLLERKATNERGLPILYEACWNIQWELFGWRGPFDYQLGVTSGAVTNPNARVADGLQALARVAWQPLFGLHVGLSGAFGPYIAEPFPGTFDAPLTDAPGEYMHRLLGFDVEWARGPFQVFSEGYLSHWETPEIDGGLDAAAGYVEGRMAIAPGWFAAGRLGAIRFNDVEAQDGSVTRVESWDDDVWRIEGALGYRISRETLLRLSWQHYGYQAGAEPDESVLAIQLSAVF